MPWDKKTFAAVCAGLRGSAANGEFVPRVWANDIQSTDQGGYRFFGCGWGVVGWFVAVYDGGAGYAKRMLPVGSTQVHVDHVLQHAGVTAREIDQMTPQATWEHFDRQLNLAYANRHENWAAFIHQSMVLAEFFIKVLSRVPVVDTVPKRQLPLVSPPAPVTKPAFFVPPFESVHYFDKAAT